LVGCFETGYSRRNLTRRSLLQRIDLVEIEIEFKNIDAGLAEKSELSPLAVPCDNFAKLAFVHPTLPRDPCQLEFGIGGCDVRI